MYITWQKMVPELIVSNFKRSLAFYTDILGFEVLYTRHEPEFAYLEQEDLQLMLLEAEEGGWTDDDLAQPYGRGLNLQMELADIGPIYSRLTTTKVVLYRDIKDAWRETGDILTGSREFWVQDPDGYLLRFCQPLGSKPLKNL